MKACGICGKEQKCVATYDVEISNFDSGEKIGGIYDCPSYNIDLLANINGTSICNECMDKYRKIDLLMNGF